MAKKPGIFYKRLFNSSKFPSFISCFSCKNRLFGSQFSTQISEPKQKIRTESKEWCGVVGLEIHAQIFAQSKMFSGSATFYGASTNNQVAFFDAALPGTLPVLNQRCVEAGVKTALALNCQINKISTFDRKHYFYADMPAGFQITQYHKPLAVNGQLEYVVPAASKKSMPISKTAGITQIQLEIDSGKSLHDHEDQQSLIDLNRAGIGLMEIVTNPDFTNGTEASAFLKELQLILVTLSTCDGKMSEGSFRVDANVSVHRPDEPYGTRTEVKNINSIRNVSKAINYEIKRQIQELEEGNSILNETLLFDPEKGETVRMRDKEGFQDYRFMPEPNLPPVYVFDKNSLPKSNSNFVNLDAIQNEMPKLPNEKRKELKEKFNLSLETINLLLFEEGMMNLFEAILNLVEKEKLIQVQNISNLLMNDFLAILHSKNLSLQKCNIPAEAIADICILIAKKEITKTTAKNVLIELFNHPPQSSSSSAVKKIIKSQNWFLIKNEEKIKNLCKEAILKNPLIVKKYKKGRKKTINPLISYVLNATDGCADPQMVTDIMKNMLSLD